MEQILLGAKLAVLVDCKPSGPWLGEHTDLRGAAWLRRRNKRSARVRELLAEALVKARPESTKPEAV